MPPPTAAAVVPPKPSEFTSCFVEHETKFDEEMSSIRESLAHAHKLATEVHQTPGLFLPL
ncbi:hypothetical protein OUZ56_013567 [Daphnia magna]|uniref:Uncharacterized protein n=1 Tax=Daphnia magna TaxID=35525 RepID=A0ABQ9Z6B2_9CRUS|nr:hypothetical protein OUZ56_013567 [Daphnia magna]